MRDERPRAAEFPVKLLYAAREQARILTGKDHERRGRWYWEIKGLQEELNDLLWLP